MATFRSAGQQSMESSPFPLAVQRARDAHRRRIGKQATASPMRRHTHRRNLDETRRSSRSDASSQAGFGVDSEIDSPVRRFPSPKASPIRTSSFQRMFGAETEEEKWDVSDGGGSTGNLGSDARIRATGLLTTMRRRFVGRTGALRDAFLRADERKDGALDAEEMAKLLDASGCRTSREECLAVIALVDQNDDGKVAYEELLAGLFPEGRAAVTGQAKLPSSSQTQFIEDPYRDEAISALRADFPGVQVRHAGISDTRPQSLADLEVRGRVPSSVYDIAMGLGSSGPGRRMARVASESLQMLGTPEHPNDVCVLVGELGWHGNGGGQLDIAPVGVGGERGKPSRTPVHNAKRATEVRRAHLLGRDRLPAKPHKYASPYLSATVPLSRSKAEKTIEATKRLAPDYLSSDPPVRITHGWADAETRAIAMDTSALLAPLDGDNLNTHSPSHYHERDVFQTTTNTHFASSPSRDISQLQAEQSRRNRIQRVARAQADYEQRISQRVQDEKQRREYLANRGLERRRQLRAWYEERAHSHRH